MQDIWHGTLWRVSTHKSKGGGEARQPSQRIKTHKLEGGPFRDLLLDLNFLWFLLYSPWHRVRIVGKVRKAATGSWAHTLGQVLLRAQALDSNFALCLLGTWEETAGNSPISLVTVPLLWRLEGSFQKCPALKRDGKRFKNALCSQLGLGLSSVMMFHEAGQQRQKTKHMTSNACLRVFKVQSRPGERVNMGT